MFLVCAHSLLTKLSESKPGTVVSTCNPSPPVVEVEGSEIHGHPCQSKLHRTFKGQKTPSSWSRLTLGFKTLAR